MFLMVSVLVSKKIGIQKSIGIDFEKKIGIEKVSDSVSTNSGNEKSIGIGKKLVSKKVSDSVSFRFWVSSHTDIYLYTCQFYF